MVQKQVPVVRTKRVFTEEFKGDSVRLVTVEGYTSAAAAALNNPALYLTRHKWLRTSQCGPTLGANKSYLLARGRQWPT